MLGPFDDLHNRVGGHPNVTGNVPSTSRNPIICPDTMSGSIGQIHTGFNSRYAGLTPPTVNLIRF